MKTENNNNELLKEKVYVMINIFSTVFMEFNQFIKGKGQELYEIWLMVIKNEHFAKEQIKKMPNIALELCATKEKMPSLAEIIKNIHCICPF